MVPWERPAIPAEATRRRMTMKRTIG